MIQKSYYLFLYFTKNTFSLSFYFPTYTILKYDKKLVYEYCTILVYFFVRVCEQYSYTSIVVVKFKWSSMLVTICSMMFNRAFELVVSSWPDSMILRLCAIRLDVSFSDMFLVLVIDWWTIKSIGHIYYNPLILLRVQSSISFRMLWTVHNVLIDPRVSQGGSQ